MGQDDTLSYKALFELLEKSEIDDLTRNIIERIQSEYNVNHLNDFKLIESNFDDSNKCPRCNSEDVICYGHTKNKTPRYKCKTCGKVFNKANNSLLFGSKVNISAWFSFLEGIVSETSIAAAAKKAKISPPTSSYWMDKIFISIKDYQDEIVLSGDVYLDETYFSKEKSKIVLKNDLKLRGLSINQYCVLIARDDSNMIIFVAGMGKPRKDTVFNLLKDHIKPGSNIYHDDEASHGLLVEELKLKSHSYKAKLLNDRYNKETFDLLKPINDECKNLNFFLDKHRGFKKEDSLQDFLNLYAFISNRKSEDPNLYSVTYALFKRLISVKRRLKF